MKKLFTTLMSLVAMLTLGISAHATDYIITGDFNNWVNNRWSEAVANYKLTETTSGVYTISIAKTGFTGKFLVVGVNAAGTGPDWNKKISGAEINALNTPVTYQLNSNNNCNCSLLVDNPTVTVDTNNQTITISGAQSENEYGTVYMVGDINGGGWDEGITTYPMRLKSGTDDTWEFSNLEITKLSYIKFRAGNYVYAVSGSDVAPETGTEYTASRTSGDKTFKLAAGTYSVKFVLPYNGETGTATFVGGGETPGTDYSSWYVNIIGPFNGWEDNGANPVDGIATHEGLAIGTEGFKVKIWDGRKNTFYIQADGKVALDTWTQMDIDGYDMAPTQIEGATEGEKFNVKYNCATNQIYVEKAAVEIPNEITATFKFNEPATLNPAQPAEYKDENGAVAPWVKDGDNYALYLTSDREKTLGENNSALELSSEGVILAYDKKSSSATTQAWRLYVSSDIMELRMSKGTGFKLTAPEGFYFESFTVTDPNTSGTYIDQMVISYTGQPTANANKIEKQTLADGETGVKFTYTVDNGQKPNVLNIACSTSKTTKFQKLTVVCKNVASGIEGLDSELEESNAPVYYYNLQGVRVANPSNGIYIRVQGKKATKVMF